MDEGQSVAPAAPIRGRAPERGPRQTLRRLTWVGIGLPIAFVFAVECFRFIAIENDPVQRAEHVAIAAVTMVAVVGFALAIFGLVERAERQIVRQNRELIAINSVSTAVQGEIGVERIIDSALETVIERSGATEASVVVFAHDGQPEGGLERSLVVAHHASPDAVGSGLPHLVDIPLTRGQAVVGRLRLHLPEGVDEPDLLTSATLSNIGHQLACAIQIGQLVADLERRREEGHGFYDVLLRVSNQNRLPDILEAVVGHARRLLQADDAVMCLAPSVAPLLEVESATGMTTLVDGTTCLSSEGSRFDELEGRPLACAVRVPAKGTTNMQVTLTSPDGSLGELWVGRHDERSFNGRDRGYLRTLAELAVIAITGARMREHERQAAALAERDRIAREMHDSLAQVLGTSHLRLRALGAKVGTLDRSAIENEIAELAALSEDAYRDVREAILGLRESSRADRGLFEGLRAYLDKYGHQSGVRATLETDLDDDPPISPRAEIQVIRVIQEALANVRKHARVGTATVRVSNEDSLVVFVIEDEGRGFDLAQALLDGSVRFGLQTMRERMELVGGTLSIESEPGRGTRVIAAVPRVAVPGPHRLEVTSAV